MSAAAVRKLLDGLDSDEARTRQEAQAKLAALDVQAEAALKKELAATRSAEVRRSVRRLLGRLESPGPDRERLREVRAVEVLESIGTRQARALLARLAKGADARLTREAKEALARLAARGQP